MNTNGKPVAVVIGATSKWQSDGRNTRLVHGGEIDDSDLPVGVGWGVGGAISLKFAREGFFTVLTTRNSANAAPLEAAIRERGDDAMIVELDLASRESISSAFARIREEAGDPDVLVYNAGYLEGRDLPPEMELMENIPFEMYETAQHIANSGEGQEWLGFSPVLGSSSGNLNFPSSTFKNSIGEFTGTTATHIAAPATDTVTDSTSELAPWFAHVALRELVISESAIEVT